MKTTYLVRLAAIQRGAPDGPLHNFTNKKAAIKQVHEIAAGRKMKITGTYNPEYELDKEELQVLGVETECNLSVIRTGYYLGSDDTEEYEVHLTKVY